MLPSETTIRNRYRLSYVVDERPGNTVYRGRDEQTGRMVLLAALVDQADRREDLVLLARQVAGVHHDAILPLLDHFAEGELYYLVCDDTGGQDLERTLKARGGPLPEKATITQAQRMLDALAHLHSQKPPLFLGDPLPSDLWIAEDGRWQLAPFALIRPITHTPSPYRAPELDLRDAEPTATSDLYALNALLYQALTGWPPPTNALRTAGTPLNAARALNPALSVLAEQVLLRGLQLRSENRYQVAREMHLSLEMAQMMAGRPLGGGNDAAAIPPVADDQPLSPVPTAQQPAPHAIYPVTTPQGAYQQPPVQPQPPMPLQSPYQPAFQQPYPPGYYQPPPPRKRGIATGCLIAVAVVLMLLAVTICAALAWFIPGSPLPSLFGLRAVQPTALPANSAQSPGAPAGLPALGANAITLQNASQITQTREITGSVLGPVIYAPNGKTLAIGVSDAVNLRDASSLDDFEPQRWLRGHTGLVNVVAWSPDSTLLATGAQEDPRVLLWDPTTGKQTRVLDTPGAWPRSLAFAPGNTLLAAGMSDATIRLWRADGSTPMQVLKGHTDLLGGVAWSPDGTRLASGSRDGTVRLWDVSNGQQISSFSFTAPVNEATSAPFWTTGVAFAPDGKTLAVGSADGILRLLDATTGKLVREMRGHTDWIVIRGVQFAPDGKTIVSASTDGTIRLWDAATGTQTKQLDGHGFEVLAISLSADGKQLASASDQGGQVTIWDVAQATDSGSLAVGQGLITAIIYSSDSNMLGTIGFNGTARLELLSQNRSRTLFGASANKSLAFLPDDRIVSITDQKTLVVLGADAPQGTPLTGLDGEPFNVVTSANGKLIIAGSTSGSIGLWDAATGAAKPLIHTTLKPIYTLATNADGSRIAVSGPPNDPRIQIWDSASGKLLQTLSGVTSAVTGLAVQPSGALVAATDTQGALRIWNTEDGKLLKILDATQLQHWFSALAWSPDGQLLATGSPNGDIVLRNAATGESVAQVPLPGAGVFALAFSPDGQSLAAGRSDQTVRIFTVKNS